MTRKCNLSNAAVFSTCIVLFTTGQALAQMTPSIPSLSADQVSRLNNGEVILDSVEGAAPIGEALGVINYSAEAVMEVIRDFESYPEFMSDMAMAEIVGQDGEFFLCHGITDTPWPMDDREWTIRASGGHTQVDGVDVILSTWTYVEGNIVDTEGYWLAIPWGDGSQTLLRYRLQIDLGTWLPDFLMAWAQESYLPSKITNIRARLDSLN